MANKSSWYDRVGVKVMPARYCERFKKNLAADLSSLLLPDESEPRTLEQFCIPLNFREMALGRATPARVIDIWDVLFRAPRLAIIGEAGAGKTITLKHVAVMLAQGKMPQTYVHRLTFLHQGQTFDQLLPIYMDIGQLDLHADDLAVALSRVLAQYGFPGATNFLRTELQAGRCLLLLDNFDPSHAPECCARLKQLLEAYPKTQMVVAARTPDVVKTLPDLVRFEPLPFSDDDVEKFTGRRLGKGSPAALALLHALERSSALRSLAGNPLLLSALACVSETAPSLHLHLPDLYERCLQVLLGDKTDWVSALARATIGRETSQALQKLALYFHERRQEQFSEAELKTAVESALKDLGDPSDKASFLAWMRKTDLLRRRSGKQYAFLRVALQEFLTAQAVARTNRLDDVLRNYVDDAWWHEVIVLATALLDNAEDVVPQILATSTKPSEALFLAARCAGEDPNLADDVKEQLRPALFEILEGADETRWRAAAAYIAALEKQRVRDYYPKMLRKGPVDQRVEAALVMGRIGAPEWATAPLLAATYRSGPWQVRSRAAWALGQLGDKRAIRTLVGALKDEREEVASAGALALSAFGELAVPSLISSLSSDHPMERQMAVEALGNMGSLAVRPLLNIVQNEKLPDDTIKGAARALGLLGDVRAVPPLVYLLRAGNGRLIACAAAALAAIGEPAVQPLIDALPARSAELVLQGAIKDALVTIGKPSIDSLIRSLNNPNAPVRNAAQEALTRIGPTAIEALVAALRTEDWNLRRRIAQILGELRDPSLVEPLMKLVRDENPSVRGRAAQVLGQIGQEKAVEPLIDAMRDDPDEYVRRTAIKALTDLHSTRAIGPLIEVLEDAQLRDIAALALTEIGEAAVEPLIQAVNENRLPEFQQVCIKALDSIGLRGRFEEPNLLAVARVYSLLFTEQPELDEMISLLDHIRCWEPGEELHRVFSTARMLLQARSLRDVAEYPEELAWVDRLEHPFRPAIKNILRGLNNVAQNMRLYLLDSRRAGQRDAMLSAIDTMTGIQETIDTQLQRFEKKPFADIVERWRALTEDAIKNLRGRALLEIEPFDEVPLDRAAAAKIVFRLTNVGDGAARNLSVTLKQGGKGGFEVVGQPTQNLYPLGSGMQQDVEFWIKPLGGSEAGYSFEVSYDDDEGTGHFHPTSGRIRFFVVGEEYRPVPTSPYVWGPVVKTRQMFYGRQDVFDWMKENISGTYQQNILILQGERRMGKTSILYQLLNRPPTPQHICVFFSLELAITTTMGDLLYDMAIATYEKMTELGLDLPEPAKEEFLRSAQRSSRQFFGSVEGVLGDRRLLIMIDEIDILIAKVEEGVLSHDVFNFMRGLMQHSDKIAFIVTGAYKTREMLKDNKSIFFNIARPYEISYLTENEAEALIVEPLAEYLNYDDMVVAKIIRVTACHPYFIQYICDSLVKLARRMRKNWVYLPDIDVVLQEVIQDNTGVLQNSVYAPLRKPEQKVLAGLANVTDDRTILVPPAVVAQVLDKHGLDIPKSQLLDALRSLRERDLVVERRMGQSLQYGFKMDLIRMWLRQNEMLLRLSQEAKV